MHWLSSFGGSSTAFDPAFSVAILVAVLTLPLAVVAIARRRALRASADDPAPIWFAFARLVQWVTTAMWLAWLASVDLLGAGRWMTALARPAGLTIVFAAPWMLCVIPPALVSILMVALSHAVSTRLKGPEWTLKQSVTQALVQQAALILPLLALITAGGAVLEQRWRWMAALGVGALIARIALLKLQVSVSGLTLNAVTAGELRDRAFALAANAGVKLRQIYVLPAARARLANAFAVRGGTVLFTDVLLSNLGRRELDAVLAHEVAHLEAGHPQRLRLAFAVPTAILVVLLPQFGVPLAIPIAVLAGMLVLMLVARRFEYAADAGAVKLSGDPEALITALVRIGRLNCVPLDWGGWSAVLLTHPATRRRALEIGKRGGLAPARVEELLRLETAADDRYPLPAAGAGKVFSTRFKLGVTARLSWLLLVTYTLTPALVFLIARAFSLPQGSRPGLDAVAVLITLIAALVVLNAMAARPYRNLQRELRDRLAREGLDPDRPGGTFVGITPDATPRIYENFGDWDVGFLFLHRDRLHYVGEETRFSLGRDEVRSAAVGDGVPGWLRVPRLWVEWQAGSTTGTLSIRPASPLTLLAVAPETRRLGVRLEAWRSGEAPAPDIAPALPEASAPAIGAVTSRSPRELAHPRTLAPAALITAFIAAALAVFLGLPFAPSRGAGCFDVFAVAMLTQIALRIPAWRSRERGSQRAVAEIERAA